MGHLDNGTPSLSFVVGACPEAHGYFLEQIGRCLPKAPPRRVFTVQWPVGPLPDRALFLASLARALGCGPEEIASRIRDNLQRGHVVLLHSPPVAEKVDDGSLLRYHVEILPQLIQTAQPSGCPFTVKVVQALTWEPVSRWVTLAAWVMEHVGVSRWEWIRRALGRRRAMGLVRAIQDAVARQGIGIATVALPELRPIERQDVEDWVLEHQDVLAALPAFNGPSGDSVITRDKARSFAEGIMDVSPSSDAVFTHLTQHLFPPETESDA